jgi:hypothetical protein
MDRQGVTKSPGNAGERPGTHGMLLAGPPHPSPHKALVPASRGRKLRGLGRSPSAAKPQSLSLQQGESRTLQPGARGYRQRCIRSSINKLDHRAIDFCDHAQNMRYSIVNF